MNTPKRPSVLDQWEAEAKRAGDPADDLGMDVHWRERFLDLIDLVRKKDHGIDLALRGFTKHVTETSYHDLLKQTIAFTEQLK